MKSIDDLLSLKEVKAEFERQSEDVRRSSFFNYLLKRVVTRHEAELWLNNKNVEPEDAAVMLNDAERANLINDIFYAKEFITGHDNWGRRRIIFELKRRGISDNDISDAFSELESESENEFKNEFGNENERNSEYKKIIPLISSWLDSGYDLSDRKDLNKIKGRLYRRGFSERDINSALDEFI